MIFSFFFMKNFYAKSFMNVKILLKLQINIEYSGFVNFWYDTVL